MLEMTMSLNDLTAVYDFTNAITQIPCDIDLIAANRRYVIDAKSIMGVLSLDLTHPLTLKAYTEDPEITASIRKIVEDIENGN